MPRGEAWCAEETVTVSAAGRLCWCKLASNARQFVGQSLESRWEVTEQLSSVTRFSFRTIASYRPAMFGLLDRFASPCAACDVRPPGPYTRQFRLCPLLEDPRFPEIQTAATDLMACPVICSEAVHVKGYPAWPSMAPINNSNSPLCEDRCDVLREPYCWLASPWIVCNVRQFLQAERTGDGLRFCPLCCQYYCEYRALVDSECRALENRTLVYIEYRALVVRQSDAARRRAACSSTLKRLVGASYRLIYSMKVT